MRQQFCACCGKGSSKQFEHLNWQDQPYTGNLIVVRRKVYQYGTKGTLTDFTLWDGESYEPFKSGAFCSVRCATEFANAAVRAGFRVVQRESA